MKINRNAFSLIELSIVVIVVGILIAGITSGSRVVQNARLKSAKMLTQSSNIASMTDIVMWFETTNTDNIASGTSSSNQFGIAEDGDAVVTWRDNNPQTQHKLEITIPDDANAPTYVENGINNLPSIKFDSSGVGDYFINDNIQFSNDDYSIFFVFESFSSSLQDIISLTKSSIPGLSIEFNADGQFRHLHRYPYSGSAGGDSFLTETNIYQPDKPQLYSLVRNGSNTTSKIWINNILKETNTTTTEGFDSSTLQLTVGAMHFLSNYARFTNGYISEIVIFDRALRERERLSVQDYLAQKYQITVAL